MFSLEHTIYEVILKQIEKVGFYFCNNPVFRSLNKWFWHRERERAALGNKNDSNCLEMGI